MGVMSGVSGIRIVSLIASSTEIACALGFEKNLVGRSHECDYPESIRHLPACSETKFVADGKSYEIDQRIKAILQEGLSVYRVDAEKLKTLQPDVILTQIQCEVCAVSRKDVEEATRSWMSLRTGPDSQAKPEIVSLNPNSLSDIWNDIQMVADALHAPERGKSLIQSLKTRIAEQSHRAVSTSSHSGHPRVACIEWIDPLMAAGNWVPELVTLAGGVNLFGEAGKHSPWMGFEDLIQKDPDVIVVLPCGFTIEKTREEMPLLTRNPGWKNLKAVRDKRVYLADGNSYFNRPGPRVVESLEIFLEIFYPELRSERMKGTGWVPYFMD
jgi:iron complex transport system substrate-binding protein